MGDKTILLTFDYEMFLAKSGTFENNLYKPVNSLLGYFYDCGISTTFFIDIMYFFRLLENKHTIEDSKRFKEQLQTMVEKNHRIELHLHPHWLDAEYKNGQWIFPHFERYRLHSLSDSEIIQLFEDGVGTIESIAREVDSNYKVLAFRAGGFCIQPFNRLREAFVKSGIIVDSSVAYGCKGVGEAHDFNFSAAPHLDRYCFSEDPTQVDQNGPFVEFPIATFPKTILDKMAHKSKTIVQGLRNKEELQIFGDGCGISPDRRFRDRIRTSIELLSLEGIHPKDLVKKVERSANNLITIVSHPKTMTPLSFRCIEMLRSKGWKFANVLEVYSGDNGQLGIQK